MSQNWKVAELCLLHIYFVVNLSYNLGKVGNTGLGGHIIWICGNYAYVCGEQAELSV